MAYVIVSRRDGSWRRHGGRGLSRSDLIILQWTPLVNHFPVPSLAAPPNAGILMSLPITSRAQPLA